MLTEKIDLIVEKIESAMVIIAWTITLLMTGMIVLDVFLRFVFNHPLPASFEISAVAMPYIVMFGFAHALTKDIHVRVSIVQDRLSPGLQAKFLFVRNLFSFGVCSIITYWSWLRFWKSYCIGEEMLAAINIPWWIGKLGMPIGFAMLGLRFLLMILIKNSASMEQTAQGGVV